jgi:hypothetical protein
MLLLVANDQPLTIVAIPGRRALAVGNTSVALECELVEALLIMESTTVLVEGTLRSVKLPERVALHYDE